MPTRPEKVYYFGTCLIDLCYPQAGMAGIELLQRQGIQVIYPQQQSCCGQPAYNSGFPEEARKVARQQLKAFPKDYPIIVPSGSCGGMLKHHYPKLFADRLKPPRRNASPTAFSNSPNSWSRVLDIKLEDRGQPIKVTWHSSCSALREMRVIDHSKSLLRQLKNVELIELQRERECCGFGGSFCRQAGRYLLGDGRRQGGGYRANRRCPAAFRRLRLPDEHRRGAEASQDSDSRQTHRRIPPGAHPWPTPSSIFPRISPRP
jgi:L-lactate dehydrogenase complex protein LldE